MIYLNLSGEPIAWKRPGQNWKTKHTYDAQKVIKEQYRWCLRQQYKGGLITTPVILHLRFNKSIPKGTSAAMRKAMLAGTILPTKRPDNDNYEKLIMDTLTGVVYADDSQVVDNHTQKRYAEFPGVMIKVEPISLNERKQEEFESAYVDEEEEW